MGQVFDASGNVIGSVKGRVQTAVPASSAPNDGGSGSVPQLLLAASEGTGQFCSNLLSSVKAMQHIKSCQAGFGQQL